MPPPLNVHAVIVAFWTGLVLCVLHALLVAFGWDGPWGFYLAVGGALLGTIDLRSRGGRVRRVLRREEPGLFVTAFHPVVGGTVAFACPLWLAGFLTFAGVIAYALK